ncbi:MAG: diaminopimelate epimerase [Rhodothalassiaceae bacterium]
MDSLVDRNRPFHKMQGLGNDFLVFDARRYPLALEDEVVRALADRRTGVGFDQLIIMRPSKRADLFIEIRNADGSEVAACGNASRCVAAFRAMESGKDLVRIETRAGIIEAEDTDHGVRVDMGRPGLDWRTIPLAHETETRLIDLGETVLGPATAVSMGNPHLVFFPPAEAEYDLARDGARLERHPILPEGGNISFVKAIADDHLIVEVWERGAGATRACGTAACAALVAAHRRGFTGRAALVEMPGGPLEIEWDARDHVLMEGATAISFIGFVNLHDFGHRS